MKRGQETRRGRVGMNIIINLSGDLVALVFLQTQVVMLH